MQLAEGIGKAAGKQLGETFPFLIGKTGIAPVGAEIFKVDLLVGYVQVAAKDHGLLGIQLYQIAAECRIPF